MFVQTKFDLLLINNELNELDELLRVEISSIRKIHEIRSIRSIRINSLLKKKMFVQTKFDLLLNIERMKNKSDRNFCRYVFFHYLCKQI